MIFSRIFSIIFDKNMITFTVVTIIISILSYYSFNNVSDPKYYIINKYKDVLVNYYELELNSTLTNIDLKKNILFGLKDIISIILFLDFDAFIDNHEKYTHMNQYSYNFLKNISNYNNQDKYLLYDVSYTDFRHYYFDLINSNLTTIIHEHIDKYMSKHLFDYSEKFFKIFNLNIKKYTNLNLNSKYDLDKIFYSTIIDEEFTSLFNNNELLNKFKEKIKDMDSSFYCIQIIDNKCNTNYHLVESKKIKIYDMFDFTGKYVNLNECCTF